MNTRELATKAMEDTIVKKVVKLARDYAAEDAETIMDIRKQLYSIADGIILGYIDTGILTDLYSNIDSKLSTFKTDNDFESMSSRELELIKYYLSKASRTIVG